MWSEDHALQRIDVFCSVATGTPNSPTMKAIRAEMMGGIIGHLISRSRNTRRNSALVKDERERRKCRGKFSISHIQVLMLPTSPNVAKSRNVS
jgi:hypothetical protein